MRKATIDVGSNSVLLLVEERTPEGWRFVHESTEVTALGAGTKETGLLGEEGIADTLAALRRFFDEAHGLGAESVEAAATMAARIARNTDEFRRRAEAQGTPVAILSGEDEAELGFRAVADDPAFSAAPRLSIVDPGGHSTELVTAERTEDGWNVRFRRSYPVGTLGLRGTVLPGESPNGLAVLQASALIDDTIGLCYRRGMAGQVVVLGAAGTNLVSIRERLTEWDPAKVHGAVLDYEEIGRAVGWLMPMTDAERRAVPGMEPGREKTIHIGALILERFLNAVGAPACSVSVRGWRYALLEQGLPKRPAGEAK